RSVVGYSPPNSSRHACAASAETSAYAEKAAPSICARHLAWTRPRLPHPIKANFKDSMLGYCIKWAMGYGRWAIGDERRKYSYRLSPIAYSHFHHHAVIGDFDAMRQ